MNKQICKPLKFSLLSGWIFLTVLVLSLAILPVVAKDGVFRTANVQTFCKSLGVMTVPSLVVVDNARHPGIYIISTSDNAVGQKMKLVPGMVLLTIDGYSISSSKVADEWMHHRGNKPLNFTYAMSQAGKPTIVSDVASFGAENGPVSSPANAVRVASATRGGMVPQEEIVQYCVTMINAGRKSNGLEPLREDARLARLGQEYADYMAQHQKDYETTVERSPHIDLSGRTPAERAQLSGVTNFLNENIGRASRGARDDRLVLKTLNGQMLTSPGHRENMLDPKAHTVGIGIARLPDRFYLTEEFGD
jgi:uncharacterized protein YkwD